MALSLVFAARYSLVDDSGNVVGSVTMTGDVAMTDSAIVPLCQDSDGGINYNVSGNVTTYSTLDDLGIPVFNILKDRCGSENNLGFLFEFYCDEDIVKTVRYRCPSGCVNRACGVVGWIPWNSSFPGYDSNLTKRFLRYSYRAPSNFRVLVRGDSAVLDWKPIPSKSKEAYGSLVPVGYVLEYSLGNVISYIFNSDRTTRQYSIKGLIPGNYSVRIYAALSNPEYSENNKRLPRNYLNGWGLSAGSNVLNISIS